MLALDCLVEKHQMCRSHVSLRLPVMLMTAVRRCTATVTVERNIVSSGPWTEMMTTVLAALHPTMRPEPLTCASVSVAAPAWLPLSSCRMRGERWRRSRLSCRQLLLYCYRRV